MGKTSVTLTIKLILIVLVVTSGIFSLTTFVYMQENNQKSAIIKTQIEDIQDKIRLIGDHTKKIGILEVSIVNQSRIIENQTGTISNLNFTVFDQKDTLDRQMVELRRRADNIDSLENNVSLLKGEIKTKESEIVSLTPTITSYFVAAVKGDGGGAIIPLEIKVLPKGTGLLSVNIKNVELQAGAQDSVRLAAAVASQLSRVNLNTVDVDVSFVNQGAGKVSVDGPSAGGAMTAAIYAALAKKSISSSVLMTGTIETDGSIGSVGGVDRKATAARDQGARKFLVPKGQKVDINNLEVIEVANINEVIDTVVR